MKDNLEQGQQVKPDQVFYIVFSDDWGEHPSSCQHLFRVIAKEHQVLWVNTIGMRNMKITFGDFKKAFLKIKKMFLGAEKEEQKIIDSAIKVKVIQPFMLPFVRSNLVRRFNAGSVIRSVQSQAKDISSKSPVVVTTVPNSYDYIGYFNQKKIVYYCVDDFSEWPGLDHELVQSMEEKLVENADCFIATSSSLYNRLFASGKPTNLLTHGVDIEHFANLPEEEHPLLAGIPKPRVGYFGLFDERNDQDLLASVAKKMSDISFVITGKVVTDIHKLKDLSNVYFTGAVSYDTLPSIVTGWDICVLPYKINKLSDSINPLKLREYIVTGKPIVSVPIDEAMKFCEILEVANGESEWYEAIARLLSLKTNKKRPLSDFETNSWQLKAVEFQNFIK